MSKKGNTKACPFTDEIVSYMYDEFGGEAESAFETHLEGCTVCTDEFAAAANTRFSVYEWKKEVFDPMPTPVIVIPFDETRGRESYPVGFLAAVRAWAESLSLPVAVAAALAVCVGLSVLVFSYLGKREPQIAANAPVPTMKAPDVEIPETINGPDAAAINPPAPSVRPVTASAARPVRLTKHTPRQIDKPANAFAIDRTQNRQKAPALTADQEPDDNSLRLADLFDEVGG